MSHIIIQDENISSKTVKEFERQHSIAYKANCMSNFLAGVLNMDLIAGTVLSSPIMAYLAKSTPESSVCDDKGNNLTVTKRPYWTYLLSGETSFLIGKSIVNAPQIINYVSSLIDKL